MQSHQNNEPEPLRRGKAFHRQVQRDWSVNAADGKVFAEKSCTKPSGRKGRMDVFVDTDGDDNLVAVAEIKASDWDAMTESALRRNVRRYTRQIWSYIESQLARGHDVSPGIIFSARPNDESRLKLIESQFEEKGIPVVWDDESIEKCRTRHSPRSTS